MTFNQGFSSISQARGIPQGTYIRHPQLFHFKGIQEQRFIRKDNSVTADLNCQYTLMELSPNGRDPATHKHPTGPAFLDLSKRNKIGISDPQERVYSLPVQHGRYVSDCGYVREGCVDHICPRVTPILWHSGHYNNSMKGNPKVAWAFCRKQWLFFSSYPCLPHLCFFPF